MGNSEFYNQLMIKFNKLVIANQLMNDQIIIKTEALSPMSAIGEPLKKDFPILKGKERLMQADFKQNYGQAFTSMPGNFSGTLSEILEIKPDSDFNRAIVVATFNAVCRYLNLCEKTIHCKNNELEECAHLLVEHIEKSHGQPKIALIGFQPAMLDQLKNRFPIRVLDMDKDIVGKIKYTVLVENGIDKLEEVMAWCDLIVATGSTMSNDTISNFIKIKPTIFYGTTAAGAAELMNLDRFCPLSQ